MRVLKVMVIDIEAAIKKAAGLDFGKKEGSAFVYTLVALPENTVMFQANPKNVLVFFTEEENLTEQ